VIALPCGAGKTIVGMAAMAAVKGTLILTTSLTSSAAMATGIIDKTDLPEGDRRIQWRSQSHRTSPLPSNSIIAPNRDADFPHFGLGTLLGTYHLR